MNATQLEIVRDGPLRCNYHPNSQESEVKKRIFFNAFHMNCVVHQSPGLWVRPEDQMTRYTDLETWVELARLLERGCFDALFLADVIGIYEFIAIVVMRL